MPRSEFADTIWRFVEDQNVSSTMKLVDSIEDQKTLEELLDPAKPPVPVACADLHYLLFTPFRYAARAGTRFRAAGDRNGVFYAATEIQTSAAEMAFYRLLFFLDSPDTPLLDQPFEMTCFSSTVAAARAANVDDLPTTQKAHVLAPTDYSASQRFAQECRQNDVSVILFPSVRHAGGQNVAVLDCSAFKSKAPLDYKGWFFKVTRERVLVTQRFGDLRFEFTVADFANDARIETAIAEGKLAR